MQWGIQPGIGSKNHLRVIESRSDRSHKGWQGSASSILRLLLVWYLGAQRGLDPKKTAQECASGHSSLLNQHC